MTSPREVGRYGRVASAVVSAVRNIEVGIVEQTAAMWERSMLRLGDFVELLRPMQWVKNVVVFAGPAAAMKLMEPASAAKASLTFAAFCLAASASYAVNDVMDRHADARHPIKRNRPVARGAVPPAAALALAGVLFLGAMSVPLLLANGWLAVVLGSYIVLALAYSLALKRRVLLDVIIIAIGFVLRAWAGSLAVDVPTSHWLIACMFTLCLFLGFGKRRCEIAMIGNAEDAEAHRKILLRYTPDLLNHLISVSAGIAVLAFLLYTLDTGSPAPFHKQHLFYTLPIVVYGVFRYAMLTETGAYAGPTTIILKDPGMRISIGLWAVAAMAIVYESALRRLVGL